MKKLLMATGCVVAAFVILAMVTPEPEPQVDRELCAAAEAAGVDAKYYRDTLCDPEKARAIRDAIEN